MIEVREGSYLIPVGDDTILLYEKVRGNVEIREIFKGKKRLRWVILDCMLFRYARKTRKPKITQLFVDLLEGEIPQRLGCESFSKLLKEREILVPAYYHCSFCPNLTLLSKTSR